MVKLMILASLFFFFISGDCFVANILITHRTMEDAKWKKPGTK